MPSRPLLALLAAGRARRFGADKLAAPCAGAPLASHAARAVVATGLPALCITAPGPRPGWLPAQLEARENPAAESGLASSVALAARTAADRGAPALIIHLADMPCVPAALLLAVAGMPDMVACRQADGRPGVPARFPPDCYETLAALTGDRGAAALLGSNPAVTLLACDPDDLADVDTPAALAKAEAILLARAAALR